ncbi:hypothetical protein PQX77_016490 [Marasmius sp. AFHP31]|nr:hypothetical protein PQX77_016490 [Marasmius sp. AFHP31]
MPVVIMVPETGYGNIIITALHPIHSRKWTRSNLAHAHETRNGENQREVTPARSEATIPPETVFEENDQTNFLTDDRSDDGSNADQSSVVDPDDGPNKRVRTSFNASTRPTYGPPKTPQKRKTVAPPDGSQHAPSPSPGQSNREYTETPLPFSSSAIDGRYPASSEGGDDVDESTYRRHLASTDEDVEMEDDTETPESSVNIQGSRRASPRTVKFDTTPESFAKKKARLSYNVPNEYLPPRNYSAMPLHTSKL